MQPAYDSFRMACPNPRCEFHDHLPVSSVDDDIYDNPPTVLIGTVDKFARFPWEERAGAILGAGPDPGPSLIIQDELHLISGPLGTIMGLYEAAFDIVMRKHGANPKVVASTATIRRAEQQVKRRVRPPSRRLSPVGTRRGRLILRPVRPHRAGSPVLRRHATGTHAADRHGPSLGSLAASAALEEVELLPESRDALLDARRLPQQSPGTRQDGHPRTRRHTSPHVGDRDGAKTPFGGYRDDEILELTSNVPPAEIPGKLEALQRRRGEKNAVSFVASTNMISVGVDVPRLGLMLVAGQPKTTSEYIQATSRVGRQGPGLVFTLYSPARPRDRSHYESFIPYHSALYKAVEPTSVTPFSIPARNRALHADLVVLARHAKGWRSNTDAGCFSAIDDEWTVLVESFLNRAEFADAEELDRIRQHIADLEQQWGQRAAKAESSGGLRYRAPGKEHVGLLRSFEQAGTEWPTLNSMRNIDVEVHMRIQGEDN